MQFVSMGLLWSTLLVGLSMILCDFTMMFVPSWLVKTFWVLFSVGLLYAVAKQNLLSFFAKRIVSAVFVIFVIASMTFVMLRLLPGGPFDEEKALPSHVKLNIERKYGLDLPLSLQYLNYIAGLSQGNLGYSYKYEGREVWDILKDALPISFKLGFYSLVMAFLIGIPAGLLAAANHGTRTDSTLMMLVISGISLPSFLVAPIFIYIFSFGWPLNHIFPQFHQLLVDYDVLLPAALWHTPRHYILPVLTLAIRPAAIIARLTRTSVLDVVHADFVRTARSKGLSEKVVLFHHVLRNSLVPVLTYAGPLVAGILSGSFIIELVFAIPGIAKYFTQSVFNRDYPLIMALTLMFSMMLILSNLIVDLLYKVVDPRIEVS